MIGLTSLIVTQGRLVVRERASMAMVLVIPLGILGVFGLIPTMHEVSPEFGGLRMFDVFIAPLSVLMVIGMFAFFIVPNQLAGFREKGILRRLSTTPASPATLLIAQLAVSLVMGTILVAVALGFGRVAYDMAMPANTGGFVIAVAATATALFAVGLLISAIVPSEQGASALSNVLFIPMMAVGGVWFPLELMPDLVQRIGRVTPVGAGLQLVRDTWAGSPPDLMLLVVLGVTTLLAGGVAARLFRWD